MNRAVLKIAVACSLVAIVAFARPPAAPGPQAELDDAILRHTEAITSQVTAWRRDIHEHPELSNREVRTAALVAEHLRGLGMSVQTGIAHTGVVGVLEGGSPGPVVALRADMDALPVTEQVDLPFASEVRTTYNGEEVGVMHACGHDAHTAILMGAASVLSAMRDDLRGTVKFVFQPAEEGAPEGEEGGARLMIEEGVLNNPSPEAIFALHTAPAPTGFVGYASGPLMAGADWLRISVEGRQTHGASPWNGIDPIVVASQIVTGLQTVPRQVDPTLPTIISIGSIHGGVRGNIIPDRVEMEGTIRMLDPSIREDVLERVRRTAEKIAEASGATATVEIEPYAPITLNDPELTERMLPTLRRIAGDWLWEMPPVTVSEDFSFFQREIPGLYLFIGVNGEGVAQASPNHSPLFFVNEDALPIGVRMLSSLVVDYFATHAAQ